MINNKHRGMIILIMRFFRSSGTGYVAIEILKK